MPENFKRQRYKKVNSIAFSPNGKYLASVCERYNKLASVDCTIRLWDEKSGSEIRQLKGHKNCVN